MYIRELILNNLQWLKCHKTQPNQKFEKKTKSKQFLHQKTNETYLFKSLEEDVNVRKACSAQVLAIMIMKLIIINQNRNHQRIYSFQYIYIYIYVCVCV